MYDISKEAPSIRHRILSAGLPIKSLGKELSDLDNAQAIEKIHFWMDTVRSGMVIKSPGSPSSGLGLLLVGLPGHGKTTLASVAIQELIRTMPFDMEQPGLFLDYPKFLRLEKSAFSGKQHHGDILSWSQEPSALEKSSPQKTVRLSKDSSTSSDLRHEIERPFQTSYKNSR